MLGVKPMISGSFTEIAPSHWNGLLSSQSAATPVLSWEFLGGLEQTGCTTGETGWQPLPLVVRDDHGALIGAAPLYAKGHSYGEYVFDWAWADAYERAGLRYFPKLLVASPFSPIPGTRLLAGGPPRAGSPREAPVAIHDVKALLLGAIQSQAESTGLSSAHVLFPDHEDVAALKSAGWLIRENVQFHWHNQGYGSFQDYLAALTQPKRKKVNAERRKVREAGVTTRMVLGAEMSDVELEFFYRCYERTYLEHRSTPYMNLKFFQHLRAHMADHVLLCLAERKGQPIAASFFLYADGVLYGRYWGAIERVDCLHFEVAYYTPIEWAIRQGMKRFEGGAQGEHKLARGFEPVKTYSGHWLREPAFYDAVARYLERESQGIEAYVNELEARNPVRG
ncbi:MAG: N-acetyltransferase [Burkholderiaceae bacterium]|nr:N-acetyltransferase [Burkholderiaceae bacterium]